MLNKRQTVYLSVCLIALAYGITIVVGEQEPIVDEVVEKLDVNQAEYVLDEPVIIKDGPVKLEIVGDTSHLFADEDFEKREVYLLHKKSEDADMNASLSNLTELFNSTINQIENSTMASPPPEKSPNKTLNPECNGYNTTFRRDLNLVFLINGSSLTHLLSESDPNDCFVVLFYVRFKRTPINFS